MNIAIKAFLLGMVLSPMVCAAQTDGCDAKRQSIERETYAKAHGNAKRVDGLEAALAQMNANCTDAAAQRRTTQGGRGAKKLAERERDLQKQRPTARAKKSPIVNAKSTKRMSSLKMHRWTYRSN
jgi:hypothetical protein